ncbi:outer membrane lipoprotein carrier protein LolA [Stenotrophomonas indicatrix]|uniref:outer membrane lipoprotein carrier protein LolA n=1 Tax=Stenotrophomonas indicatrix TaxID=2045451 RepID=UPI001C4FFD39|nr:outer membrane lipoprotein carrier protein LolA [Stenotrophomonas indicatrix]QXQ02417.1 outer membrane lipoprotein carrier protein LolA [Stenotrophomonas indicatrix]
MNRSPRLPRVLLCALLLVAAPLVQAADAAVDAITQAVARPDVLRGQFTQEKQVSGFKNPLRSQGQFVVARKHGVIWSTLKPFPSEVVVTADRILSRQRDGSTRVELDARQQPAMRSVNAIMFALMSGDVQALSSQFNVEATREGQGQGWRLKLTPKSAMLAKAFQSLTLQGDRYVRQVEIIEANQDRTRIQFTALSEAPAALNADEARRFE